MVDVYEEYLQMPESMTAEEMSKLHMELAAEIGNDEDALELYDELIQAAARYAEFRANWRLWSREEKMDKDPSRTSCHNSVIIKCNQLARYLKMQGKPANWRDILGDEQQDPGCRKRIGDFACYLVFVNALLAR